MNIQILSNSHFTKKNPPHTHSIKIRSSLTNTWWKSVAHTVFSFCLSSGQRLPVFTCEPWNKTPQHSSNSKHTAKLLKRLMWPPAFLSPARVSWFTAFLSGETPHTHTHTEGLELRWRGRVGLSQCLWDKARQKETGSDIIDSFSGDCGFGSLNLSLSLSLSLSLWLYFDFNPKRKNHSQFIIKGTVHLKMKSMSSITHPHIVPNLYDFLFMQRTQKKVWRTLFHAIFIFGDRSVYGVKSTNKSGPYNLCTIFQVICSHMIVLSKKQTNI